jgi:alkanesulfonate monooxygenase SsuD/methylene tetrahydromethanopterin reductase-like flavin-dependent oxidoreductase (luciferase family)
MRLSTVILPIHRWTDGQHVWRRAEELGFHAGYTYDHLSWRSFRDRPWFGAVPTLTAAALATQRLRLGTLVTSPNFRHPVPLAKDLLTLDDIAGGRLVVGIGSGGTGFDATVLGQEPWSPQERADRFEQFVRLLDQLLTHSATTHRQSYYSAIEARMIPSPLHQPRPPFLIAATGPRGIALTAEHGQGWVTYGDPGTDADTRADRLPGVIAAQLARLEAAGGERGRALDSFERVLLHTSTAERPLDSLDAFVDWAGRYREIGITELVVHWPVPESVFANDLTVFEQIATDGLAQLG